MEKNKIYHIYNRGNNRQEIFFNRNNYLFFLKKIKIHLSPFIDIFCYCLMPNHFHLLVATDNAFDSAKFSNSFRVMLSSYTRAINKQENRVSSLFQQNSKFKLIEYDPSICFHYIHQNPLKAKLVDKLEDYEFSSFSDYTEKTNELICDKEIAYKFLNLSDDNEQFYKDSYAVISDSIIRGIM